MNIALLREVFDARWPDLERAADRCCADVTKEQVWREIEAGDAIFWPFQHSAIVTQTFEKEGERVCFFWLVAGQMAELLPLIETLYRWARSTGHTRREAVGRKGWMKILQGIECVEIKPGIYRMTGAL